MSDEGHNYSFSYPKGGWPCFGPLGETLREDDHQALSEAHAKSCGVCRAQTEERP